MRKVYIPERRLVVEFPDCGVCQDRGHIESPILQWRNRSFIGHGTCTCSVCRAWPEKMKAWADGSGRTLPAEAVAAVALGKASKQMALLSCPFCENGDSFLEWQKRKHKRSEETTWQPEGWVEVDSRSTEGRHLIAAWEANGGTGRGLVMADVTRLMKARGFGGHTNA